MIPPTCRRQPLKGCQQLADIWAFIGVHIDIRCYSPEIETMAKRQENLWEVDPGEIGNVAEEWAPMLAGKEGATK
jgi:hypothetical protein